MTIELACALDRLDRPRIVVIGDLIRDVDIHGTMDGAAAEQPDLRVFREIWREERPGGAGAVREMADGLGAQTLHLCSESVHVKTRYWVDGRLVWRCDSAPPVIAQQRPEAAAIVRSAIRGVDLVIVADYGKGTCTASILNAIFEAAAEHKVPCLVDPAPGSSWVHYQRADGLKCNRRQALEAFQHPESCSAFSRIPQTIVTDGANGLTYCGPDPGWRNVFPSRPRRAIDVTGAGDTVLAALGVCVAGGMTWAQACAVAVAASGCKVERRGAVSVPRPVVVADLLHGIKIIPPRLLQAVSKAARLSGRSIVFTNGCFDLLHAGHVAMLKEARRQGDMLIVGINDDASVRRLKGKDRPLQSLDARAEVLAGLESVDYVVPFAGDTPLQLVRDAVPSVLVKGADWCGRDVAGANLVTSRGGRVHFASMRSSCSTTELVHHIRGAV